MKDHKLYIEMLQKFNELADSQLDFYKEYCKYLTDRLVYYEKLEDQRFKDSLKEQISLLSHTD